MSEASKDQTSVESHTTIPTIQQIVQRYLPDAEMAPRGTLTMRCTCPGKHKHTSRSHKNDCYVFINGVPTATCLHQSCAAEIAEVNDKIRSAWSLFQPPVDEVAMASAKEKAAKRHALEAKATASLPEILRQYQWDVDEITQDLPTGTTATDLFLKTMFGAEDLLWIGDPVDTGRPCHAANFKVEREWRNTYLPRDYGNYTCASTFKPGVHSRANDNVAKTPYLIVEGDKVLGKEPETDHEKLQNKNACGAIFQWLRVCCGLRLRAVIDSGNKSLHGWFDYPVPNQFEELKTILPSMGCDRAMFKQTQPARLAGCIRDNGKEQKLLWIT